MPQWIPEGESHQETIGHRAQQEVSAAGHEQPPALGRAFPARRRHLVPGDRHLQDPRRPTAISTTRCGCIPTDAAARGIKHGDVVSIYNERGIGAGRRLRHRAHHPRSGGHRPRGQVRPHRARARSTGAASSTPSCRATARRRTRWAWRSPASWWKWRRPTSKRCGASIPTPSRGNVTSRRGRASRGSRSSARRRTATTARGAARAKPPARRPSVSPDEQPGKTLLDHVRRRRTTVDAQIHGQRLLERTRQLFAAIPRTSRPQAQSPNATTSRGSGMAA